MLCYQKVRERNRERRGRLGDHAPLYVSEGILLPNAKRGHVSQVKS
jgi:hypothetical protein